MNVMRRNDDAMKTDAGIPKKMVLEIEFIFGGQRNDHHSASLCHSLVRQIL